MNEHDEQTVEGNQPSGMRAFILIWAGQCVSQIGSILSGFALGIAVYRSTGSVTRFALITLFTTLPGMIVLPFAGALTDRWDRRHTMILSDAGAFLSTLVLLLLLSVSQLQVWHIYITMAAISVCGAFRWPAYSAATTLLVAKANLGRASGMVQMGLAAAQILSPALAGFLVMTFRIELVILLDLLTYVFALATLMIVRVPKATGHEDADAVKGSLLKEITYSISYLKQRPGLLGLLGLFAVANFLVGLVSVLATPLILSFASPGTLGTILSIGGAGMLVGSVIMTAWGGPKRRIHGVLGFLMLSGLCTIMAGLKTSAVLLAVASFIFFFSLPITNGSSQAIWQTKIAPVVQGRVFALRAMVATSCLPLAFFLAGPLADKVFEPLLAEGGALSYSVGKVIGVGPGRGIAFLFILIGMLSILVALMGYLFPRVRSVEYELLDAIPDDEPKPQGLAGDWQSVPAASSSGESHTQAGV